MTRRKEEQKRREKKQRQRKAERKQEFLLSLFPPASVAHYGTEYYVEEFCRLNHLVHIPKRKGRP